MTICFQNITHSYSNNTILESLNLEARTGEITCLLGASGSGKSTLLRLAAGLEILQAGSISVDGEILVQPSRQPPPEARPVGLMFQENALFPHMTIAQNIAFGLTAMTASEKAKVVSGLLDSIGLSGFDKRYPHTLSGGQQQRVALARSLAPNPRILLMDEPYASIDSVLRRSLRESARQTLKLNATTTILVTHDPSEAMEMADVIAVLDKGKIVQAAKPQELFERPVNPTVATLFGDSQRIEAQPCEQGYQTAYGFIAANHQPLSSVGKCSLVVRPRGLQLTLCQSDAQTTGEVALRVVDTRYVGNSWLVYLLPDNAAASQVPLRVALDSLDGVSGGARVSLRAKPENFFVF